MLTREGISIWQGISKEKTGERQSSITFLSCWQIPLVRKGWCLCSILFMIMLKHWRGAVFITRATYVAWQGAADVCDLYRTLSIALTPRACREVKVASWISVSTSSFGVSRLQAKNTQNHELLTPNYELSFMLGLIFFCLVYYESPRGPQVIVLSGGEKKWSWGKNPLKSCRGCDVIPVETECWGQIVGRIMHNLICLCLFSLYSAYCVIFMVRSVHVTSTARLSILGEIPPLTFLPLFPC